MARMRSEERRRQLLEVSAELFAQSGYRGTTTAELAKAASVTEPILYRHFDNKLDLFVTLVDEIGKEVIKAWKATLEGVNDPNERLKFLLIGNPSTHDRGSNAYRVIFQAMTETGRDPEIDKPLRKHLTELHEFLEMELKQLQGQGAVRTDESAATLAWMLINVAIGYGMSLPLGVAGQTVTNGKKTMQKLMLDLLAAN
ncbi:MAG: TetR/AcrR family transcriptional regulator [Planctomycetota bacterium]|nr:TetR/AcrR family transcriptional regulator [Planctomycetota bacterium]